MIVVGLAGGIGTGKSEVSRMLEQLGARVLNADNIGHEVYLPGTECLKEIVGVFGEDILLSTGEVDRKVLGGKVFGDPKAMSKLNSIVWPRIREKLVDGIKDSRDEHVPVVVLDAAVLIEAGWTGDVDEVWIVTSPEYSVIERLRLRNNLSEEQVRARMNSQMATEERLAYADVVISNDGDLNELQNSVCDLWNSRIAERDIDG